MIIFIAVFPRILDMTSVKKKSQKQQNTLFLERNPSLYKNNFLHAAVHLGYNRGISFIN